MSRLNSHVNRKARLVSSARLRKSQPVTDWRAGHLVNQIMTSQKPPSTDSLSCISKKNNITLVLTQDLVQRSMLMAFLIQCRISFGIKPGIAVLTATVTRDESEIISLHSQHHVMFTLSFSIQRPANKFMLNACNIPICLRDLVENERIQRIMNHCLLTGSGGRTVLF